MSGIDLQRFWRRPSSPEILFQPGSRPPPLPSTVELSEFSTDPIVSETEMVLDELRHAAWAAGVGREDPMMPLLQSLAQVVRFIGNRAAGSDRTATEASQRVVDALGLAKTTAEAERRVFEAGLATAQARTISDISSAIARSAEAALTRRVRVYDRNTIFTVVAFVFVSMGCCSWVGYSWGRSNALAGIQETEAGLQAAFTSSPADANLWMNFMRWNTIRNALSECAKPGQTYTQDGRKACQVPLWIEPPKPLVLR